MDERREGVAKARRRRLLLWLGAGAAALAAGFFGISRIEPRPPSIAREAVWIDEVRRGDMLREVRGTGVLVPEQTRFISISTTGIVESILQYPGADLAPDAVVLELSNPQLELDAQDAELALEAAEAEYASLEVRLESELLSVRNEVGRVGSERRQAQLQSEADEILVREGLSPRIVWRLSALRAEELAERHRTELTRLEIMEESAASQRRAKASRLEQERALLALRQRQLRELQVRPGVSGELQEVLVGVGESVTPGQPLAVVARPGRLKGELRIPETEAEELAQGQRAVVDTRNGMIEGRVSRVDPAVRDGTVLVEVVFPGDLPPGARPDLSIEGTIEMERLLNVLHVGRPVHARPNSRVLLFRLDRSSSVAQRIPVELGSTSVHQVEIVAGLREGDHVVLSELAGYDSHERVRID